MASKRHASTTQAEGQNCEDLNNGERLILGRYSVVWTLRLDMFPRFEGFGDDTVVQRDLDVAV